MGEQSVPVSADLSRRHVLSGAAGLACACACLAASRARAEAPKMKPTDVLYQPKPNAGKSCNQCANFQPPGGCAVVSGEISPSGWCSLFKAKAS
jgi:hypothetical protein